MKARIIGGRYMKVAAADIPPQSIKNSCMNVYIPTVAVRDATEEVTTKAIGNSFHENTSIRRAVVSVPGLSRYGLRRGEEASRIRDPRSAGGKNKGRVFDVWL